MTAYSVTVSNSNIGIGVTATNHVVTIENNDYAIALARTGGQGSKGDSITDISLNESDDIIITVSNSAGDVVGAYNLGPLGGVASLDSLSDTNLAGITDGQGILYDSATSKYIPHTFAITSLADVDNTAVTDGAVLIYDGVNYVATPTIIGGTF